MIHEIKGNLLDSKENFICHQVNCQGAMNSGVAKQIREKWPIVYCDYQRLFPEIPKLLLGAIQEVPISRKQSIINMFAQEYYGYDKDVRFTSYDAFWNCLNELKECCGEPGMTFAFPAKIGSDRGGANWNVIKTMIGEVLKDYDVYIYEYDGGN